MLKNGVVAASAPISGDNFTHTFKATSAGRYSFEVMRQTGVFNADTNPARFEAYSSPIWFTKATNLKLSKAKVDAKKGTAKIPVKVAGPGKLALSGKNLKADKATAHGAGTLSLDVKATGKAAKDLKKKGKAKVTAKIKFTPTGGDPVTATEKVTLKKKIKK
jgi:hypothetical protein